MMSDVRISKALSWLLRHGAEQENLTVHDGGYVNVKDVLATHRFKGVSEDDIKKIVEENNKQRFSMRCDPITGLTQIRANQGHSFPV